METQRTLILQEPIAPVVTVQLLPIKSSYQLITQENEKDNYIEYTITLGIINHEQNITETYVIKDRYRNLAKMNNALESLGVHLPFPSVTWPWSLVDEAEVIQREKDLVTFFKELFTSCDALLSKKVHAVLKASPEFCGAMIRLGSLIRDLIQHNHDYLLWQKSTPYHHAQTFFQNSVILTFPKIMDFTLDTPKGNTIFHDDRGTITECQSRWTYFKIRSGSGANFTITTMQGIPLISLIKEGNFLESSKYHIVAHTGKGKQSILYITREEGFLSDPKYYVHMSHNSVPTVQIEGHWPHVVFREATEPSNWAVASTVNGGLIKIGDLRNVMLYLGLALMINKLKKYKVRNGKATHYKDGFTG